MKTSVFSELKSLSFVKDMLYILDGGTTGPYTIEIDPTNKCNFNCPHCSDKIIQKGEMLNWEILSGVFDDLRRLDVHSIVIKGGGEPTIYPHFADMLSWANNAHLKVGLLTNGSTLDTINIRHFLNLFCDWVRISFDAASPEMHAQIHGVKEREFHRIIKGLRVLNISKKNLTVGMNYCITEDNWQQIGKACDLAKSLECDYIALRFVQLENDVLSNECLRKSYEIIRDKSMDEEYRQRDDFCVLGQGYADRFYVNRRRNLLKDCTHQWTDCVAPYLSAYILANGDVVPCCFLKRPEHKDFVIGNVNTKRFWDIWMSEDHRKIIKKVENKECQRYCLGRTSAYRFDRHNIMYSYLKNAEEVGFF